MAINIQVPESVLIKPIITVFGVGGAGGNAVNNMIKYKLQDIRFVVANTDAQSLEKSLTDKKIRLGEKSTGGLGAGANPEIGAAAAEEALDEIARHIDNSNMVFITAGMGGGTGTGAAPVIARIAREKGILVIGVVTKPFGFEGAQRMRIAEEGIEELAKYVDTLIVVPNQKLLEVADEATTFAEAFKIADNVLYSGVRGITDLIMVPGLVNLDFADIQTIINEMGKAMMSTGESEGEDRAIKAAEKAISNPLLEHSSIKGARGVLINITGGSDMTLFEVDKAANRVRQEVENENANIIFGSSFHEELTGKIRVSVVATGIDAEHSRRARNSKSMSELITEEENSNQHIGDQQEKTLENYSVFCQDQLEAKDKKQRNYFSTICKKIFGKSQKEEQIQLEEISFEDEDLEEKIYDTPAFLREKEKN